MARIENKTALITGGGSGIGAATARLMSQEGAEVFVADINTESGNAVAHEIGGRFVELDVTSESAWRSTLAPYRGLFPSPPLFDRMPTYRTQGKGSLNFLSADVCGLWVPGGGGW